MALLFEPVLDWATPEATSACLAFAERMGAHSTVRSLRPCPMSLCGEGIPLGSLLGDVLVTPQSPGTSPLLPVPDSEIQKAEEERG